MASEIEGNAVSPEVESEERPRWKRWLARTLLVIFCLAMVFSVVSIWMRNQINDTDRYMRTVGPLASEPAIQEAIVARVTNRFSEFLDDATTRDTLTDRQRYLAGPLTSLLETFVEDTVRAFVTSDEFPQYWIKANEIAQPRVSAILTGSSTANMTTADGKITLDLSPLVEAIKGRLSDRGLTIFDRIPGDRLDPQVVIVDSPELAKVQDEVDLLESLALVFPFIALLAVGGYIWLSPDRRIAVIWSGLGLAIAMAALLLFLSAARSLYIDGLDSDVSKNGATAFFDTIGRYFRYGARALAIIGLLVAAIAIATRPGSWLRQERADIARQLSAYWHSAVAKVRQTGFEGGWTERHRAWLLAALIIVAGLAVGLWNRNVFGWAVTLALIIAIGVMASRLLLVSTTSLQTAPAAASAGIEQATTATTQGVRGRGRKTPTVAEPASTDLMAVAGELSAEDLEVLRRLAIGLRDTKSSS